MSDADFELVISNLISTEQTALRSIKSHAQTLLDCSPRFKYLTLHGSEHLNSLFSILNILINGGIVINNRDLFLLSAAICTHDLGMVIPLKSYMDHEIFKSEHTVTDPVNFENHIRDVHHEVISKYFEENDTFVSNLGLTAADLAIIELIGKSHRKIKISTLPPQERRLGALMRLIDELDIGPQRAPLPTFDAFFGEMEWISKWHWYKHIITAPWHIGSNVNYSTTNGKRDISFFVTVYPARQESISYWLPQVARPIEKALGDEECREILRHEYGITVNIRRNTSGSRISPLGPKRIAIEDAVLTGMLPVVLIIDDESKKIEDLFYFAQNDFHIHRVPRVKSGLQYLEATKVAIAVIDMQMPDDGLWGGDETAQYRLTGTKVVEEIKKRWPNTKVCILSGTRYPIPTETLNLADIVIRKPVDPIYLHEQLKLLLK
jgi:hypothetical protein